MNAILTHSVHDGTNLNAIRLRILTDGMNMNPIHINAVLNIFEWREIECH